MNKLEVTSSLPVQYINDFPLTFNARMPSMRNPASSDVIPASVVLCDTACLFLKGP